MPFQPRSLFDLLPRETLVHLLTGFRENLRGGVTMYCTDVDGKLVRVDPEEIDEGETRFWSQVCTSFRSDKGNEKRCCEFDEEVASRFLSNPKLGPTFHPCEPLGLIDMAAPVIVAGKPLAVVIAGQCLPREKATASAIIQRIREVYPQMAEELIQALEIDYQRGEDSRWRSNLYSDDDVLALLQALASCAAIIADICRNVVDGKVLLRQREFQAHSIRKLSDGRPLNLTTWQQSLESCLDSLRKFLGSSVERIGLFSGQREGDQIGYSLMAMNSSRWWKSAGFRCRQEDLPKPRQYPPNTLPEPLRSDLGPTLATTKHFLLYPFAQPAARAFGEVFSLVALQASAPLAPEIEGFYYDFCDSLCRRDSVTRLFLRQTALYQDFEQQVVEVSHDLRTSIQHIVYNIQDLLRYFRNGGAPGSTAARDLFALVKGSVNDHRGYVTNLKPPGSTAADLQLESLNLFEVIREQVQLYSAVAQARGIKIDASRLPQADAYLVCERYQLTRAISALLDNAVKYSYDNRRVIVSGQVADERAQVVFENYGIGVPPDKLAEIRKPRVRALILDTKKERFGTGLGLPIAEHVFEELLGGNLDFESSKPPAVAGPTEQFHRFVTKVTVEVPIRS